MEAKGDYLTFVDGDDWIEPQMYETLLAAMTEQDADLAVCRYRKIYENRRVDLSTPMAAVFEGQELLAKYLEEDEAWLIQTAVWNKIWKRSLSDGCYSIRRSAEVRIRRKKNIRHFCSRK